MAWEKSALHQKGCQLAADPRAEAVTEMEGSSAMTKMDHRHQRNRHTPKVTEPITLLVLYNSIQGTEDKGTHSTVNDRHTPNSNEVGDNKAKNSNFL